MSGLLAGPPAATAGAAAAAAAAGAGGAAGGEGAAVVSPAAARSMTESTSPRVIRPPLPVPVIEAGSRPCSVTSCRTTGDRTRPPSPFDSLPPPPDWGAAPEAAAGGGAAAALAAGGGGAGGRSRSRLGRGRRCGGAGVAAAGGGGGGRRSGGRRRGGRRRGRSGCSAGRSARRRLLADQRELGADVDRLAFRHEDLGENAGRRRGDLGVDLVGRHLEQRLVVGDRRRRPSSASG